MFYQNGDIYDGDWYQDVRDGYCLCFRSDVGKWRNELFQKDNFVKDLGDFQ